MKISFVVAVAENNVIGRENALAWTMKSDLAFFKSITIDGVLVMGKNTFISMNSKPLPGRENIVLSKSLTKASSYDNLHLASDIDEVLRVGAKLIEQRGLDDVLYVIGGQKVFEAFFHLADEMYITKINARISGDVFFPNFSKLEWRLREERFFTADERNQYDFSIQKWGRI